MSAPDTHDGFPAEFWRSQEILLLKNVMALVGRGLDLDGVLREVVHLLSELLGLNRARIIFKDPEGDTYRIRHAYGLTTAEITRGVYRLGEGITGTALKNRHLIIVQDIDREPLFLGRAVLREHLPSEKVAFIAMPIDLGHNRVGLIACHRLRHRNRNLSDDIMILQIISTLIGQLMKLGDTVEEQTRALHEHNQLLENALENATMRYGIIGTSPALLKAIAELEGVSHASSSVLLCGAAGTGKELFARALHMASPRRAQPFVRVNCAAIPENAFETELFGHERGAFPGARARRTGQLEQAHTGTLFLDEVGELPLAMQGRLLHVFEQGTFTRAGTGLARRIDIRVVSATSQNLRKRVEMGLFRYDLFYHLNVIPITLPTLAARREDIPLLCSHFLSQFNQRHERNISLSRSAVDLLTEQDWPGHIRQLSNVIERVVLLAPQPVMAARDLRAFLHDSTQSVPLQAVQGERAYRPYLSASSHSKEELLHALRLNGGNKSRTAQQLGMTARQLHYRLKLFDVA
ncbi:sigma-54-dependent Fis family transcriptional regulator [Komagataeibacter oboediens]